MKNLSLSFLFCFISSVCFAGREGNGGAGVKFGFNRIYLMDLYEYLKHPIEIPPSQNSNLYEDPFLPDFAKKMKLPASFIQQKLSDIELLSPSVASLLVKTWSQLTWTYVKDSSPLPYSDDFYHGHHAVPKSLIVQLALRKNNQVLIHNASYWDLDNDNRTALLIHEGLSAMYYEVIDSCHLQDLTSQRVRKMVGLLYKERDQEQEKQLKSLFTKLIQRDCTLIND